MSEERLDIEKPLWDLNTFQGRWKHFAWMTDFRTCILPEQDFHNARQLYEDYKLGREPAGTTREQIIYAKKLYESAFHPDTGTLQNVFGRMSFQVPGGMLITGAMLQFYKTKLGVFFWQWVNQSFNALVNYSNRNANSPLTETQLGTAYVCATAMAILTARGCQSFLAKRANPLMMRYVPFAAVAAANCANIPLMRQNEITQGVEIADENGNKLTKSKIAPVKGISQVVISRIVMCAPGMLILPPIMEKLEKYRFMQKIKPLHLSIQVLLVGCFLTFMVPTACALFPQRCSIKSSTLEKWEPENYKVLRENCKDREIPMYLYFNKGL
ncbi:sideroflexin 2 [Nomia melanderi]|uniref:sideroflexin 2 n=1 Tax=Nomia melanderi TaxID=2448451 RepID=UPI001304163C|nr:sideroflexin-2 [Nomia melanderi]XP_031843148.1 sideroflexin-2 [Nomia melanderi]XP_031843149.1 sideroflexin-2 [Nomia melanderi]XP_031843150.1 sideroflexin-2 [Nomia melanderi]XP_031843151.1 sideroflexin-2 [Nomia melanderi]XP_031843152.1 sideroflexin-2 [Nomia melanderi]XP_031843153.1 sideroflexin-2 [Nomia melanderi]XP_031843154.1 sideroflexin-2 [Nomia melanderi]XP_031843156.1 sideroflexin-2 [Nomia melanderi]XP_031843157.1 sideroflexin-2 [Nomia melanderi]XP_031843158.1 sideroflexin-2 [Nomi